MKRDYSHTLGVHTSMDTNIRDLITRADSRFFDIVDNKLNVSPKLSTSTTLVKVKEKEVTVKKATFKCTDIPYYICGFTCTLYT